MGSSGEKFPKAVRLIKPSEFQRVKKEGKTTRAGAVKIASLTGNIRRLGVVVSKRVGKANQRNRLKRVVREFFRKNKSLFPRGDNVVIFSPGVADLENDHIRKMISKALAKITVTNCL